MWQKLKFCLNFCPIQVQSGSNLTGTIVCLTAALVPLAFFISKSKIPPSFLNHQREKPDR